MAVPPEIESLTLQINQILEETEQQTINGLALTRQILDRFPENTLLIQFFAYLNSILLFAQTNKAQTKTILNELSTPDVTIDEIQEAGEDLGTILGRVLETKVRLERIIERLEILR